MANLYNVGDSVVCQKKGGQTGTKPLTPSFEGKVVEVLPGGTEYRVSMTRPLERHFPGNIVKEADMTAA